MQVVKLESAGAGVAAPSDKGIAAATLAPCRRIRLERSPIKLLSCLEVEWLNRRRRLSQFRRQLKRLLLRPPEISLSSHTTILYSFGFYYA
jgi:hypothetical protein